MSNHLIMIPYGKAVLCLTLQEVREGLRRGKAIKRHKVFKKRLESGHKAEQKRDVLESAYSRATRESKPHYVSEGRSR